LDNFPTSSFFLLIRRSSRSTLFPYTTLFRSYAVRVGGDMKKACRICAALVLFFACAVQGHPQKSVSPPSRPLVLTEAISLEGVKDRKSTRLNSSHQIISYAVFCLKKKNR